MFPGIGCRVNTNYERIFLWAESLVNSGPYSLRQPRRPPPGHRPWPIRQNILAQAVWYQTSEILIQCGAVITRKFFSPKSSHKRPHSSPRYGVSFVTSNSDSYSASVKVEMLMILCYIGSLYNGTPVYIYIYIYIGMYKSISIFRWVILSAKRYLAAENDMLQQKLQCTVASWHFCLHLSRSLSLIYIYIYDIDELQQCLKVLFPFLLVIQDFKYFLSTDQKTIANKTLRNNLTFREIVYEKTL